MKTIYCLKTPISVPIIVPIVVSSQASCLRLVDTYRGLVTFKS